MDHPALPLSYPFPPGEHGTPPPLIEWARKNRPICPVRLPSGAEVWMVTRKDHITQVLTDPRFSRDLAYSGAPRFAGEDFTSIPGGIFNLDPPDHTRVRNVVYPFYTRGGVAAYQPLVERHAAALLEAMADGPNPADLVASYAAPLPLRVSCEILGVPVRHRETFLEYFHTQVDISADPDQVSAATQAISEFSRQVIKTKRDAAELDGPIGALINAEADGVISDDELHGTVSYLFVTGSEPLVAPMASGPYTLMRHRNQLQECVADPALWPAAVEEVLRYHHNGVLGLPRVTLDDVPIHNTVIRKGEAVCTPMLGATWDAEHYRNPHRFNIHRTTDGSATFGAGPHFCLGASLARMFLRTAYTALFQRFPKLALAVPEEQVPWAHNMLFTRPVTLPVFW